MLGALRTSNHRQTARRWWMVSPALATCLAAYAVAAQTNPTATLATTASRPKLLSKEVFIRHDNGRPAVTGFITYISKTNPVLMHCFGREDYSDGYDDYAVQVSTDNGRNWSKPELRWKSTVVPEGRMRYAEPAAFFDPDQQKLIVLIDHTLYPKDKLNVDTEYKLELNL